MTQLKLDQCGGRADDFDCNRIKHESQVLCWANGIMQRLWDRWMMAQSPGVLPELVQPAWCHSDERRLLRHTQQSRFVDHLWDVLFNV